VERAKKEFAKMGLRVHILTDYDPKTFEHYALIFIDINSMKNVILKKIRHPLKKAYIEENWLVVKVWTRELQ